MTVRLKQNVLEKQNEREITKRRFETWEIVLLVLGSPIWFSVLIGILAIIFSIYIVLWSVVISLWAFFVSVLCSAFAGIIVGIGFTFSNNSIVGFFMIAVGFVLAGLSIFLFFGCRFVTRYLLVFTKNICLWLKRNLRGGCNE